MKNPKRVMPYKILKITSFYKQFLDQIYNNNKTLKNLTYQEQYLFLMGHKYAWSDFFKKHIEPLGAEIYEIIHNADHLQNSWQLEFGNNLKNNILFNQINYYKPEILFFQDIKSFSGAYIKHLRESFPFIKLIFGHSCSPYSKLDIENYMSYDFLITCLDSFKIEFENHGIKTYKLDHGFEPSVLEFINQGNNFQEHKMVFIGSFIPGNDFHNNRVKSFEKLLKEKIPLTIYGNIIEDSYLQLLAKQLLFTSTRVLNHMGLNSINQQISLLKKISTLKSKPQRMQVSEVLRNAIVKQTFYGLEMYKLLSKAKIALNMQAGVSGDYAVNMRLFEATGVGTLLLTDYKKNIREFFEPDYEIVTYNSIDECIEKSKWLLLNPSKMAEIARAGQLRTLKDHNLKNRFYRIFEIIKENLK